MLGSACRSLPACNEFFLLCFLLLLCCECFVTALFSTVLVSLVTALFKSNFDEIGNVPFSNYSTLWLPYCSKKCCKGVTFTSLNLAQKYRILKYQRKSSTQI